MLISQKENDFKNDIKENDSISSKARVAQTIKNEIKKKLLIAYLCFSQSSSLRKQK